MNNPAQKAIKPCGYSVLNQYRSAILELHAIQRDNGCNNISKEALMSDRVKRLLNNVKQQKIRISKQNFDEKLTSEFAPYTTVNSVSSIEEFLFEKNSCSKFYGTAALRDRYCLLMTTNGILRGESLFKCELSDLCDVVHNDTLIHVMRIATGKTNGLKVLYGRCIRHKDVNLCAVGALGIYLLARFHFGSEAENINFQNNAEWFSIKLLIDTRGADNTKSLSDNAYYKCMKDACNTLGITSKHFVHFGRGAGPVRAELEELDGFNIADLGNWNVDTRRDVYSAKLPMKAMRVMAGHPESKGSAFLQRAQEQPSIVLQQQFFTFIEIALQSVNATCNPTAIAFLNMLQRLRIVILQDAAVMVLHGRKHCIFDLPIFTSAEFKQLVDQMRHHETTAVDPTDASIEQILPSVCSRFSNLHSDMTSHFSRIHESVDGLLKPRDIQGFLAHVSEYNFSSAVRPNDEAKESSEITINSSVSAPKYNIYKSHSTASSIWFEWFGTNQFDASTKSDCFPGGIDKLQQLYKNNWRLHFTSSEAKQFSRMKLVVQHIHRFIH